LVSKADSSQGEFMVVRMMFQSFNSFMTPAMAQATSPAGTANQPSSVEMMLPFVVLFAVMYFFLIRPQSKKQKSKRSF
jgi:hypothetical protein